jgi:SAM-dependent methyltransferase
VSLDTETRRDRYFAARDRELATLIDPKTGRLAAGLAERIECPLCSSPRAAPLFTKQGFDFVRCVECGLVYVNPQLRESVVLKEYEFAETSDLWFDVLMSPRQEELDRAKFRRILDLLEAYRGGGRILDVGCSTGLFLELARARGWTGVGIEFAPRARAYASEARGLEVLDVPLARAGFEPETFDAVALLSVLEHTNDPRRVLRECARVLRHGGALYVIVPNVESVACRVLRECARTFDGRNHLVYFSGSTLTRLLDSTGFEAKRLTTAVSSLEPVLEYLAGEEPYSGADLGNDPLAQWVLARRDEIERAIEEVGLGYKLHCLATRRR